MNNSRRETTLQFSQETGTACWVNYQLVHQIYQAGKREGLFFPLFMQIDRGRNLVEFIIIIIDGITEDQSA